jgi:hypothetical protein
MRSTRGRRCSREDARIDLTIEVDTHTHGNYLGSPFA